MTRAPDVDLAVLGAGAAGLLAALAARGALAQDGTARAPEPDAPRVLLLDGSSRPGLKILVSGGGRCNVTNERVAADDYDADAPPVVRALLAGFPPASVRRLFESRGCPLYAEPLGKLFPRSDRARDVLDVLLSAVAQAGVDFEAGCAVTRVTQDASTWRVETGGGRAWSARRVIVATGGKSLPRTGSTGFGLELAEGLGHAVIPPLPALAPIFLDPGGPLHGLAGVTVPALLSLVPRGTPPDQVEGRRFRPLARAAGSLLVTHQGASGPAALDVSGACARAIDARSPVTLEGDFLTLTLPGSPWDPYRDLPKPPGACLPYPETPRPCALEPFVDAMRSEAEGSRRSIGSLVARFVPRSLGDALLRAAGLDPAQTADPLPGGCWRRVHRALAHADLRLTGTDGYAKAEVTCGGVPLRELHRTSLESRLHPGLHFCGEVVNCTGRLGGFNFQWAWSSGYAAGDAARRALRPQGIRA